MSKSQPWTCYEDQLLIQLHREAGCFQRWKFISKKLKEKGIEKTQFQCRDRFTNHVDPSIRHGRLSRSEVAKLFGLYDEYGPRWSYFQSKITGWPQNLLKNKFYSTLRSLVRHFIKAGQKRNSNVWRIQSSKLPSKLLTDLYQGKKKFLGYKNLLKACLKNIEYCLEGDALTNYIEKLDSQLLDQFLSLIHRNSHKALKQDRKQVKGMEQQSVLKCEQQEVRPDKIKYQCQPVGAQHPDIPINLASMPTGNLLITWIQVVAQQPVFPALAYLPQSMWDFSFFTCPYQSMQPY